MRSAFLAAAAASLFAAAPAAAVSGKGHQTFVAVMNGGYEVPAVATSATGTAELDLQGSKLHYAVHLNEISDVTGAYLHIGRAGEERPVVADLFEGVKAGPVSGLLASGTLEPRDLHHEITWTELVRALDKNDVYVSVHTMKHPAGEIRGDLRAQPMVSSGGPARVSGRARRGMQ